MALVACGGDPAGQDDPDMDSGVVTPGTKPVGARCAADGECASPTTPDCLPGIKPLDGIAGVPTEIASLGLDFSNGYCSSVVSCADNSDCATQGACFRPFRNVTAATLDLLEASFTDPAFQDGSLDFLPSYGVCLATCETTDDCAPGLICALPLADLISAVPDAINDSTFCVSLPGCDNCDLNARCERIEGTETGTCVCKEGFSGTGTSCSPATSGSLPVGSPCTSDIMCSSPSVPDCLDELKPLSTVAGVPLNLRNVGLEFPYGYCSSVMHCSANIQCGAEGRCFQPFRDVTSETLRDAETSINAGGGSVATGSLDFLATYGVCLHECDDVFDCDQGQVCEAPLAELISLLPGATNDRTYCVPNEDCENCSPDAFCDTTVSPAMCVCKPGFDGSMTGGVTCTPTGNGPCAPNPCRHGGTCAENGTDFTCTCAGGYTGTICQIAPTGGCGTNPCLNGGSCADNGSGYICSCAGGYTGTNCETPPDNCSPNPCLNGGACTGMVGGYSCACTGGYTGTNCQTAPNPCAVQPCQNGGACTVTGPSTYTCACTGGYTGANCQTPPNPCAPNPCMNAGTCNATGPSTYTCSCAGGYTGTNCEIAPTPCSPNPCMNAGTCNPNGQNYTCSCAGGYTGTNCEIPPSLCAPNPCMNGGTCSQNGGSYTCACAGGYTGTNCQTPPVNPCSPNPCSNGGTCAANGGSYTCSCPSGWTGPTCTQNVDECLANPCMNGGTCSDTMGSYTCGCPAQWSGMNCQTDVNECMVAPPCLNGGTCTNSPGSYSCACTGGYTGTNCETAPAPRFCDVIYHFGATTPTENGHFHTVNTGLGSANRTVQTGLNDTTASGITGPFAGGGATGSTFRRGYVRLRFNADGAGTAPVAGPVSLIEYYMPVEFAVSTLGTTVTTDVDHSAGLLNYNGTCAGGITGCLPSGTTVALNRTCSPIATGTVSGTTLTWDGCSLTAPAPYAYSGTSPSSAQLNWAYANSQVDTSVAANFGCIRNMSTIGNVTCTGSFCGSVPAGTLGAQNATWDQELPNLTFQANTYATTRVSVPEYVLPDAVSSNYSGGAIGYNGATVNWSLPADAVVECGTLAQLTCNEY